MDHTTSIAIDAPPEAVWAVLADVSRWSEWTRSVERIELLGPSLGLGGKARVKQPRLPAAVYEVTDFTPGKGFAWRSTSGGVTTVGDHQLAMAGGGHTVVELSIRQTGLMAPVARLLFGGLVRRYVDMEAEGLKRRSEAVAGDDESHAQD